MRVLSALLTQRPLLFTATFTPRLQDEYGYGMGTLKRCVPKQHHSVAKALYVGPDGT